MRQVRVCVLAVSSGSITVNADSSVQLLAEEAVPLDQLDISVSTMSAALHSPANLYQHVVTLKVVLSNNVFMKGIFLLYHKYCKQQVFQSQFVPHVEVIATHTQYDMI